ncbi:MAG: hypothetical protein JWM11_8059 [Planctomycetaceae bacterium]|nr:hypothetical protein [Planctomycetaceae bacterium]
MSSEAIPGNATIVNSADQNPKPTTRPLWVWPTVALVALYWIGFTVLALIEIATFTQFLIRLGLLALTSLLFTIWWLINRQVSLSERFLIFGVTIAGAVLSAVLSHTTVVLPAVLMLAVPALLTVGTIWLVLTRNKSPRMRQAGLLVALILIWGAVPTVRMEGLSGDGQPVFRWRFSPSSEDRFLATKTAAKPDTDLLPPVKSNARLVAEPGDWLEFRGPQRDGAAHGISIATNWNQSPPKQVWRQPVGPGWSSVVIVGQRLFTQDQRGESEAVVCLDTATGQEIWAHLDANRFAENLGGVGPRATPTFSEGLIYALGPSGLLNCLDAITGKMKWSRDIKTDSKATVPMWGFSGSPLVVDGLVVVFAGGDSGRSLLAYDAGTGKLKWSAAAGQNSYASPQLMSFGKQQQILFPADKTLTSVDPQSGSSIWKFEATGDNNQPSLQPQPVGKDALLVSFSPDTGTTMLDLSRNAQGWQAASRWTSRDLKPFFNDFVVHEGSIYGFDGKIFCCVDLQSGTRKWKQGRYGNGQVLLLADQPLLVIISESGEAVQVAANPEKHEELGRFQAVTGKTWNHPVVAHGHLYVRNAEEIACFDLQSGQEKSTASKSQPAN